MLVRPVSMATIRQIADRAGIGRVTVYRHFPDELTLARACGGQYLEHNALVFHLATSEHLSGGDRRLALLPNEAEDRPLAVAPTLIALLRAARRHREPLGSQSDR